MWTRTPSPQGRHRKAHSIMNKTLEHPSQHGSLLWSGKNVLLESNGYTLDDDRMVADEFIAWGREKKRIIWSNDHVTIRNLMLAIEEHNLKDRLRVTSWWRFKLVVSVVEFGCQFNSKQRSLVLDRAIRFKFTRDESRASGANQIDLKVLQTQFRSFDAEISWRLKRGNLIKSLFFLCVSSATNWSGALHCGLSPPDKTICH